MFVVDFWGGFLEGITGVPGRGRPLALGLAVRLAELAPDVAALVEVARPVEALAVDLGLAPDVAALVLLARPVEALAVSLGLAVLLAELAPDVDALVVLAWDLRFKGTPLGIGAGSSP
jgi:hypothetical protein